MRYQDGHRIVLMVMHVQFERRDTPGVSLVSRVGCGNRLRSRLAGRVLDGTIECVFLLAFVLAIHPTEGPPTAAREGDPPSGRGLTARLDNRGARGPRTHSHIVRTAGERGGRR